MDGGNLTNGLVHKVFYFTKWVVIGAFGFTGLYLEAGALSNHIQKKSVEKNLTTLVQLADQDKSKTLDNKELYEMLNACGGKFDFVEGGMYFQLTNKQLKNGIGYFEQKELNKNTV